MSVLTQETVNHIIEMLPEYMVHPVLDYVEYGDMPERFLQSVLSNDLMMSFAFADEVNRDMLGVYAQIMFSFLPAGCHGSLDKMKAWSEYRKKASVDASRHQWTLVKSGESLYEALNQMNETLGIDRD